MIRNQSLTEANSARIEIHVFRESTLLERSIQLIATCSSDELRRSEQFVEKSSALRFLCARGMLRQILTEAIPRLHPPAIHTNDSSKVLHSPPIGPQSIAEEATAHTLRIIQKDGQKPCLASNCPIDFNVSHTEGCIIFAISSQSQVGVDVERIRHDSWETLAQRHFSSAEHHRFANASPEQKDREFFLTWTKKESFLKAIGEGVGKRKLSSIDTEENYLSALSSPQKDNCNEHSETFAFYQLSVPDGFIGHLAAKPHAQLCYMTPSKY